MIRETAGDLLAAGVDALVCPVNTVGVMGAGLAHQFKAEYPIIFQAYERACRRGELRVGDVMMCRAYADQAAALRDGGKLPGQRPGYVINFPTKQHWRDPSQMEWISAGLAKLRETIDAFRIHSIAIPPLGCGLGGLDWAEVRSLLYERLGDLGEVEVVLYALKETNQEEVE